VRRRKMQRKHLPLQKSIRKSKNADEEGRWEEEEIKKLDKIEKM
jgi:hypothetical protein